MDFNLKTEEINYIKFSYKGKDEEIKDFRAIVKSYNDRELIAYAKNKDNSICNLPQETTLHFICDNGMYEANTIIKSIEIEEPYIIFIFERPKNISYEQKREFFRIPASFKCIYKLQEENLVKDFQTKSIDISANGISILITRSENIETVTELSIFMDNKYIQTKVNYIRTEKYNDSYKCSFTYTEISSKDQDFISQFCFQKQLEKRRNSLK